MNTQNVKTAAPESTERWGKKYEILLAEGVKGGKPEEYDVYGFETLKALQAFRKKYPEQMKMAYSYTLSSGTTKAGSHISVCDAEHFKAFNKLVKASGIEI